ncbi:hypothetical protein [Tateyamaria sp.]|uniref:hypothetical protein n=1 Tax=Tateyamaria sp. TaxID=1929288 RepID=UPI00329D014E
MKPTKAPARRNGQALARRLRLDSGREVCANVTWLPVLELAKRPKGIVMYLRSACIIHLAIAFASFLSFGVAKEAMAQNRNQLASDCLKFLSDDQPEQASIIAEQMKSWQHLFGTKLISDSEDCLKESTGEYWKYFPTKSQFLSGKQARQEQEFVNGADARRATKENELKLRECRVIVLETEVEQLELKVQQEQYERRLESQLATWTLCADNYERNKDATLLEPVCNALFMSEGLPDSSSSFFYLKLQSARLNLIEAQTNLLQLLQPIEGYKSSGNQKLNDCRQILQ